MLVKINGKESEIPDNTSIHDLVSARKLLDKAIFIERNGAIIARKLWETTRLAPDDSLEIIRLIGGG